MNGHTVTDIHSHILFGIDDGAADLPMSLQMAENAWNQGIGTIFCTSHSWSNLKNYFNHFMLLQKALQEQKIPVALFQGCEIACCAENISYIAEKIRCGEIPCMGKSNYLLLEFFPDVSGSEIVACINRLKEETQHNIILAHTERYTNLLDDFQTLGILKHADICIQINAYSLVEEPDLKIKKFAQKLLEDRMVTFVGSDAHRTTHRSYSMKSGIEYIYSHCDSMYADKICFQNAEILVHR